MTWQRIDEDTYIDDTLVTCAEYQLFIDEMREQRIYYHPDHWTSYQFPAGKAREPILGVRHSDAKAFCKWLTERDEKEWRFRLSIQKEVNVFRVKPIEGSSIGYWILDQNYQFVWIGVGPKEISALDLDKTHDRAREFPNLLDDVDFDFDLAFSRNHIKSRSMDIALAYDLARRFNLDIYYDLFNLQKRIAGRSPAFEGIRLLKERIK